MGLRPGCTFDYRDDGCVNADWGTAVYLGAALADLGGATGVGMAGKLC